jgi:hypothetical protein
MQKAQFTPAIRLFPKAATPAGANPGACHQNWGMSCAQTAIIPTKSVIDANAAASSTNVLNMPAS